MARESNSPQSSNIDKGFGALELHLRPAAATASVLLRGAAAGPQVEVAKERVAKLTIHDDDDGAPADDDAELKAAFLGRAGD
jgi:hypothetical protein